MIIDAGTYRTFGDQIVLTEDDVDDLLRSMAARGLEDREPRETDDVMIVAIGSNLDLEADVFLGYAMPGHVDALVKKVAVGAPGVNVISYAVTTYAEYKALIKQIASERSIGRWFHRTPKMNAWLCQTFAREDNDNDDGDEAPELFEDAD